MVSSLRTSGGSARNSRATVPVTWRAGHRYNRIDSCLHAFLSPALLRAWLARHLTLLEPTCRRFDAPLSRTMHFSHHSEPAAQARRSSRSGHCGEGAMGRLQQEQTGRHPPMLVPHPSDHDQSGTRRRGGRSFPASWLDACRTVRSGPGTSGQRPPTSGLQPRFVHLGAFSAKLMLITTADYAIYPGPDWCRWPNSVRSARTCACQAWLFFCIKRAGSRLRPPRFLRSTGPSSLALSPLFLPLHRAFASDSTGFLTRCVSACFRCSAPP